MVTVRCYNIMQCIAELMVSPDIYPMRTHIALEFQPLIIDGERCFSNLWDSHWWEKAEAKLREDHGVESYLLPIILHLDSTSLDVTGKHSICPVSITLGNFPVDVQVFTILFTC